VEREFKSRDIQLVISDPKPGAPRGAAPQHPGISFDHVGIIAYCKPHFPAGLWLAGMRDAWGYRTLMGIPRARRGFKFLSGRTVVSGRLHPRADAAR